MEVLKKIYGIFLQILILVFGIDFAKKFDTRLRFKRKLNLKEPKSLADKIAYLELHKQSVLASKCTDKYEVRNYVEEKGLKDILVPLVGGPWSNIEEIDFDKLPSSFAIKATHGCKMNYLVPDKGKFDKDDCEKNIKKWLRTTYGTYSMEPHYLNIPHRIYAEEFLLNTENLIDYKFFCLNGKPEFVQVCSNRKIDLDNNMSVVMNVYDMEWNKLNALVGFKTHLVGNGDQIRPTQFEKMKKISSILSKDFNFVRVDLYELKNKVYFGELTFTPACGVLSSFSEKFLLEQGRKLKIN